MRATMASSSASAASKLRRDVAQLHRASPGSGGCPAIRGCRVVQRVRAAVVPGSDIRDYRCAAASRKSTQNSAMTKAWSTRARLCRLRARPPAKIARAHVCPQDAMISVQHEDGITRLPRCSASSRSPTTKRFEEEVIAPARRKASVSLLVDLRDMLGFTVDVALEDIRFTRAARARHRPHRDSERARDRELDRPADPGCSSMPTIQVFDDEPAGPRVAGAAASATASRAKRTARWRFGR